MPCLTIGAENDAAIELHYRDHSLANGNFPATDGSTSARHFTGARVHHHVPNAGHNLPQEAPDAFVGAILELADLRSPSGGA